MKLQHFFMSLLPLVFMCFGEASGTVSQTRWCYIQQQDGWLTYNDTLSSCVSCGGVTRLYFDRSSSTNDECCENQFLSQCGDLCNGLSVGCGNGNTFCANRKCDGYNDCGDGSDEVIDGAEVCGSICLNNQYKCNGSIAQCFLSSAVCDGVKHCFSGSDEMNCLYYEGRCPGFLCTVLPQCVPSSAVCDGRKDCYDGTDESHCILECDEDKFRCNTVTTTLSCSTDAIEGSVVCDGRRNCIDGRDEDNCYFWSSWSVWSLCFCPTSSNGIRQRTRNCATFHDVSLHIEGTCTGPRQELEDCACISPTVSVNTETTHTATSTPSDDAVLSIPIIVVIGLSGMLVLISLAALVYFCWTGHLRREKKQYESPYNPHVSLGRDSVFSTNASIRSVAAIHYSPSSNQLNRRSMHGSVPNILGRNSFHHSSMHGSKQNIPLPNRPDEDLYEHIKEPAIDPYAETQNVPLTRSQSSFSLRTSTSSPPPYRERSSSIILLPYEQDQESDISTTIVRTYSLSSEAQRARTACRIPIEDLGQPPLAPTKSLSKSVDCIARTEYLQPVGRPGTTYTTMTSSSPLRRNRDFAAATMTQSASRQKQSLNESQHNNLKSNRYMRRKNKSNASRMVKSVYIQRSDIVNKSYEDLSYHSDSYATMKRRESNNEKNPSGCFDHESLSKSTTKTASKRGLRSNRRRNTEIISAHSVNTDQRNCSGISTEKLVLNRSISPDRDIYTSIKSPPDHDPPKLDKSRLKSISPKAPLSPPAHDPPKLEIRPPLEDVSKSYPPPKKHTLKLTDHNRENEEDRTKRSNSEDSSALLSSGKVSEKTDKQKSESAYATVKPKAKRSPPSKDHHSKEESIVGNKTDYTKQNDNSSSLQQSPTST